MSHNDPLFVRYCDDMSHMCMTTIGHKDYGPRNIGQYNEEPDTVAIVFHQRMPGVSCDMDDFGDGNAKRLVACWNACAGMADPAAEIAALRAEVERLKADAERLDFIASRCRADPRMDGNHVYWPTSFNHRLTGPNLRAAIDAARGGES